MSQEIERKFLVNTLPDVNHLKVIEYERSFLFIDKNSEIRIQKKWDRYELEKKTNRSSLQATKQKLEISLQEYRELKKNCKKIIQRKSYSISQNPEISLKIYSGEFKWLSRVEVEFQNEHQASSFTPLEWFWKEITNSPLWRDSQLVRLSRKEFLELISS